MVAILLLLAIVCHPVSCFSFGSSWRFCQDRRLKTESCIVGKKIRQTSFPSLCKVQMQSSCSPNSLPVLDVSPFLLDENSYDGQKVVKDLLHICHTIGFVYIIGHGIPEKLDNSLINVAKDFFQLDEADRLAISNTKSPHFRGYAKVGLELTKGKPDWRDQIDFGPEIEPVPLAEQDYPWKRLRGPNQWPAAVPAMRPTMTDWMQRMENLSCSILRALALGLGQPADHFDYAVSPNPEVILKVIRYPALAGGGQGVGAHQDAGMLSFIHQDGVGGLEVLLDGGEGAPIPAPRMPGAYIMNLGQMLQLATGGYLRATVHRVQSPPHPGPDRISLAYFLCPRLEARLNPLPLPPHLAAAAATAAGLVAGGQNADPLDPILATYGENLLKIRLRSHPDVAEIYYADLLSSSRA